MRRAISICFAWIHRLQKIVGWLSSKPELIQYRNLGFEQRLYYSIGFLKLLGVTLCEQGLQLLC